MVNVALSVFSCIFYGCLLLVVQVQTCDVLTALSGTISDTATTKNFFHEKCWKIQVPPSSSIRLSFTKFELQGNNGNENFVRISTPQNGDEHYFSKASGSFLPITALNDVIITHFLNGGGYWQTTTFSLKYTIQVVECSQKNNFRCSEHFCVPEHQRCDAVKDCENGADEDGCVTGVKAVRGISLARASAIEWLKSERTPSWGWQEDTPRAVVALCLTADANFNGTSQEEELMAKQTELKTAVALLRSSLTINQLSMFVNALLVTCHNPRDFYGHDIVKTLKSRISESKEGFIHPVAYLALCNAAEAWPDTDIDHLNKILSSKPDHPFIRDIEAVAVMALSCSINQRDGNSTLDNTTLTNYFDAVARFKEYQLQDGSFGSVYTTALITQALISSGHEHSTDWNLNATMKYLMDQLNSSSVDFLATYLTLPVMNGKSLADIAAVNCSAHPRKHGEDILSEMKEYTGPKIRVQYSLYVGDQKDIVHTMSLRVPENYTAYEVMELAELEDPKFKFEWKTVSGKVYVYEVAQITNDPEHGKFWLMYWGKTDTTDGLSYLTTSPDKLTMKDGRHLTMWYKTAEI